MLMIVLPQVTLGAQLLSWEMVHIEHSLLSYFWLLFIFDSECMFVTVQELLTFVAVRLFLPKGSSRLPRAVANALYQIIAMVAQQFEGYIFTVNIDEVRSQGLAVPILGQKGAHYIFAVRHSTSHNPCSSNSGMPLAMQCNTNHLQHCTHAL